MAVNGSTRTAAAARVERLREAAAEAGLDAFVATADESIAYLTGLQAAPARAVLRRRRPGRRRRRRDRAEARRSARSADAPDSLERVSYDASSDGLPELGGAARRRSRVGVEEDHIIFARSSRADEPRARAGPAGADDHGSACPQGRGGGRGGPPRVRAGRARVRLRVGDAPAWHVRARAERPGRDVPARRAARRRSHPLVLFGENAANPHADPTDRVLAGGRRRLRRHLRVPRRLLGRPHALRDRRAAVGLGARGVGARPRRAGAPRSPRCVPGDDGARGRGGRAR